MGLTKSLGNIVKKTVTGAVLGPIGSSIDHSKSDGGGEAQGQFNPASQIPGFNPGQQAGLNNMSYGMMNNIMARIMNPSLSGTNPLFTANSYTRPVLTSAQYQAPQMQQNAAAPTTQAALEKAKLQATQAQHQKMAANSGLGTLSNTDLRLLQILSGGGV